MRIELSIGRRTQSVEIEQKHLIAQLTPNTVTVERSGAGAVEDALDHPIGTKKLEEIVRKGEKIVIITSDITRPMPSSIVLPPVLRRLENAGVEKEDITIVFALGAHRSHTVEEMKYLLGEAIYHHYRVVDSDEHDVVRMGMTKRKTPVDITRIVAEADRRICLGNIEYHYFAGYSGGAKAIMPGVSTREAIARNHSAMVEAFAVAGQLDRNPVRKDLEEALQYCPADFIVNVVLNEKKQIVYAVAGDIIEAHRRGCELLDGFYLSSIDELADIVFVSQGGFPKDLNVYQTQKALDNAKHAVRPGGIIILVGACQEGLGDEVFERWIEEATSAESVISRLREHFELGGHKAAAIALVEQLADVYLVSELPDSTVRKLFMTAFSNVQEAYDAAREKLGAESRVIVMPYGGSTLPRVAGIKPEESRLL